MKHKIRDFNLEKINADMVLSLGSNCIVAHHLRKNHLRSCSSPLDWMINENLEVVYKLFKTDFKDFFIDCSMIEKVEHKANVKDNKNEIISIHHFFSNEDLKIQSQRVNHQAVQRWQNIKEKLKNSQNVVLIWFGKANFEELKNFLEQFYSLLLVKQGGGGDLSYQCSK